MARIALFIGIIIAGLLLGSTPSKARGDLYFFEDEEGVVHYTNVPSDQRYKLYRRSLAKPRNTNKNWFDLLYGNPRKRYDALISTVAFRQKLDPELIRAVVQVESDFDPQAISPKGAMGLMQLMPETAEKLGVYDLFHPETNLEAGAKLLKQLLKKYDNRLPMALAAYNAGEAAVDKYKGIPPYPETQKYVKKVMKIYKNQE